MQQQLRFSKKQSKRAARQFRNRGLKLQAAYIERRHSCHPFREPCNQISVDDFRTFKELWILVGSQILTLVEEAIETKPVASLHPEDEDYLTYHYPSIAAFHPLEDQQARISEDEYASAYDVAAVDIVEVIDTFATNSERNFNLTSPGALETLFSVVRILLSSQNVRVARDIALRVHKSYTEAQTAIVDQPRTDKAPHSPAEETPMAKGAESPRSDKKRSHSDQKFDAAAYERHIKRRCFSSDFIPMTETTIYMVDLDPPRYVPANAVDDTDLAADSSIPLLSLPPSDADEVEASATAHQQPAPEHDSGEAEGQNESAMQGIGTASGTSGDAAGNEDKNTEIQASDSALYVFQVAQIIVPHLWRSGYTIDMIANALSTAVENNAPHFVNDVTQDNYVAIVSQIINDNSSWSAPLPNPVLGKTRRNV